MPPARDGIRVSCVINFYGRLDLLAGILHSLAQQKYDRESFEVVLVEDKGGTAAGKQLAEEFYTCLNTVYIPLDKNHGSMGYSRNYGLAHSRGDIVLFLDDDTVLMQQNFLEVLDEMFNHNSTVDAIVPHGHAAYSLVNGYDFHDSYFMTSRCTAYRRKVLIELGGFMNHFVGQEDVEFVIRFLMAGKISMNVAKLNYFHPPLLVPNFRKPKAVGHSFYLLKSKYPMPIWTIALLNCSRHAPLYLLPIRRYREMGRFGIGFIAGVLSSLGRQEDFGYN
ncbi:glycosyltransferase [Pelotalea chapellei]|uniref:glycosyltransferase n=1 Tax=Pelotalea chapellei TaxID=44671 RepID=UPI00346237DF